jgi:hypothetical protein
MLWIFRSIFAIEVWHKTGKLKEINKFIYIWNNWISRSQKNIKLQKAIWKGFIKNTTGCFNTEQLLLFKMCQATLTPWSRVLHKKLRVRTASQEIPRILWKPKAHHCVHNSPPPVPILSPMNPIHIPKPCFPKIHLNVVLPSTPRSS